nr:MAG TPA: hypothetical protein [Caudoviricetes sp.]
MLYYDHRSNSMRRKADQVCDLPSQPWFGFYFCKKGG